MSKKDDYPQDFYFILLLTVVFYFGGVYTSLGEHRGEEAILSILFLWLFPAVIFLLVIVSIRMSPSIEGESSETKKSLKIIGLYGLTGWFLYAFLTY